MLTDLHMHSTASDGELSPTELMLAAKAAGVERLALTDHDTIAGLAEARSVAEKNNIVFFTGIELTAEHDARVIHIVGLNFDAQSVVMQQHIAGQIQRRQDRASAIADKLANIGVENALTRAQQVANGVPGRPHFARLLVEDGYAPDMRRVFKKFLVPGKPGFVKQSWPSIAATVQVIHQAGGVAVFAHPTRYNLTATKIRHALAAFKDADGDAMEVISGQMPANEVAHTVSLAKRFNLLASQGSDFHGSHMPWLKLGVRQALPDTLVPVWQAFA